LTDLKERFIEDHPETLKWGRQPVTPEEQKQAQEMFRWISRH